MEKQEYMAQLRALLTGRMAPAELERVTAYYEEYFDEAGPQGAQRVAEELGTPAELVQNIMGRNRGQGTPPPVREKRGIGGLWTAVLALCAAPIALPLLWRVWRWRRCVWCWGCVWQEAPAWRWASMWVSTALPSCSAGV